jgi:hypothetical protein
MTVFLSAIAPAPGAKLRDHQHVDSAKLITKMKFLREMVLGALDKENSISTYVSDFLRLPLCHLNGFGHLQ